MYFASKVYNPMEKQKINTCSNLIVFNNNNIQTCMSSNFDTVYLKVSVLK